MNGAEAASPYFVGWDVGGWNCDQNPNSRDALVILDHALCIVGKSWRGNLRGVINVSQTTRDFISALFTLCAASSASDSAPVFVGIDTPLGFSDALTNLFARKPLEEPLEKSATNPYLFRRTERFLFECGLTPLSAIKDMIGSQATKGMHALAKFAPVVEKCGVWRSDGRGSLTAIEAYPAGGKNSRLLETLRTNVTGRLGDSDDERDALTCALIAHLYANRLKELEPPDAGTSSAEGWIWLPRDVLSKVH